jgi:transcriptional regulator with XRE-family HTH domain
MVNTNVQEYSDDIRLQIGQRIQELRTKKKIAGIDLAELLNIGKNQLSRIETGKANCTVPQLFALAQILDCSVDYLLFGTKQVALTKEQERLLLALAKTFEE